MPVPRQGSTLPLASGESFLVGRTLGVGGMGAVVEATHQPSGRRLALKFLHDDLLDHPTIPQRFEREVQLATALTTAHVARTFGLERTREGIPFMIMELLEGQDLCALVQREGRLAAARAAKIVSQACEALEEAHARGIVHRDLKPENLFVTRAPDGGDWVRVLDFGISKVLDESNVPIPKGGRNALTRVGTTVGTPEYMAPEQLRGAKDLDGSADVYSLGCVLYEAVGGRRPFQAPVYQELVRLITQTDPPPLPTLRSDLPQGFADVVARAMARDRKHRIATAKALREALAAFVAVGRKVEGTVVMEPPPSIRSAAAAVAVSARPSAASPAPSAPIPSAPPAGGHVSMNPAATSGLQAPVHIPAAHPTVDHDDDEGSGSKVWIVVVVVVVLLLVAAGVVAIVAPSVFGLR